MSNDRRRAAAAFAAVLVAAATLAPSGPAIAATGLGESSDFDGDGFADVAIGAPRESLGEASDAGGVHVLFGSAAGLTAKDDVFLTQSMLGGVPEAGDFFGLGLTSADFDADGFADLVIGAPFEDLAVEDEGEATVVYGSAGGLDTGRVQTFTQDTPGIPNEAGGGDQFGGSFGVGDFDGDGFTDLAIGAREESPDEDREGAGAAHVLYGSPAGLVAAGSAFFTQDTPGIADTREPLDRFGVALEGADLDGDGFDDLAVGVHGEDLGAPGQPGAVADAGAVHVLWGSPAGVAPAGSAFFTEDSPGLPGVAEGDDLFGSELASGDFDADGRGDLAVGAFSEDLHSALDAGAITVLYGSPGGVPGPRGEVWSQNARGVRDGAEDQDTFGVSIAAGDVDGDGFDDLVAGVQGEDVGEVLDAGAVAVLFGTAGGLSADRDLLITQASAGVEGEPGEFDAFGTEVAAGDVGRTAAEDLLAGTRESLPRAELAGSVALLYGAPFGPNGDGDQVWTQDTKSVLGVAEEFDFFGITIRAV